MAIAFAAILLIAIVVVTMHLDKVVYNIGALYWTQQRRKRGAWRARLVPGLKHSSAVLTKCVVNWDNGRFEHERPGLVRGQHSYHLHSGVRTCRAHVVAQPPGAKALGEHHGRK